MMGRSESSHGDVTEWPPTAHIGNLKLHNKIVIIITFWFKTRFCFIMMVTKDGCVSSKALDTERVTVTCSYNKNIHIHGSCIVDIYIYI